MKIEIHHKDSMQVEGLAEDFKEIIVDKLKTMERFQVPITTVKVEVVRESNPRFGKNNHNVTLITHGSGPFIKSEGSGKSNLKAFDQAIAGFELQLRKIHEKKSDVEHKKIHPAE